MSLILEALRKSEAERRRGEMPDLRAELPPPVAPRRGSSRAWPWIAALAAIVLVAVLLVLRPWSRGAGVVPVPTQPATTSTTRSIPAQGVRLQPHPRATAVPPPAARAPGSAPTHASQPAESATTPDAPAPAIAAPVAETPPPVPAAPDDLETSIGALPADLRKALPPLQLSMHMWDPDPSRRFVILDGERHVEGDSIGPMRIRRIDAAGVLFDWQGRAIRLPLR